mgnify:CR=1 FL=1
MMAMALAKRSSTVGVAETRRIPPMWQAHYDLYLMRMRALEAEVERRRRWQLQDQWNGRATAAPRVANRARVGAAQVAAVISRGAARLALRLDGRVVVESRPAAGGR